MDAMNEVNSNSVFSDDRFGTQNLARNISKKLNKRPLKLKATEVMIGTVYDIDNDFIESLRKDTNLIVAIRMK